MNKHLFLTLCLVFVCTAASLFWSSILQASTIHVPADSATIQAGINGVVDGDTVLVADGTYTGDGNRDIDFLGKAIVVMSENGPENCVIDCEGSEDDPHRGFIFQNGEDSNSILQGFTITNGVVSWGGGGILCLNASPTITDNTISGNSTHGIEYIWFYGGGIFCRNSSAIITRNTIAGNSADFGGGIKCTDSSPIIKDNIIIGNAASSYTISGAGGGIGCDGGSPTIIGNTISGNSSNLSGGGIVCSESAATITGNTITGNTLIAPFPYGGGIYCSSCDSSLSIMNSIVWGNSPNDLSAYSGDPVVTYSNIQGGWEGEGNIDADPMFVQPDTSMYTDYRLLWGSPCIDTGHPDSLDADGTRSDMGAHYFNQDDYLTLYITPDMTEVAPGGQLGVTYTLINRWSQSEPFRGLTQVVLPGGNPFNLIGPDQFTLPANTTIQRHFNHNVPVGAPWGQYEYWTQIGPSPSTLYDEDRFTFSVGE